MLNDLCTNWLKEQENYARELHSLYFALCIINGFLSVGAVIGNIIVIIAVRRSSSLKSPSFLLLTNLALSDFGVGLLVQPMYIVYKASEMSSWRDIHCSISAAYFYFAILFVFVSFGTICFISIDRFLAVHLGIRYRSIIRLTRVTGAVVGLWIIGMILGGVYLLSEIASFISGLSFITLSLILTTFIYVKIMRRLFHRRAVMQIHAQQEVEQSYTERIDSARFKRSVYSMLFVYVAFVLCYCPFFGFSIVFIAIGRTTAVNVASNVTLTIVFMNSSLNPVLYYWRIPEVRRAVRKFVGIQSSDTTSTDLGLSSFSNEQQQRK